MLTDGLIFIEGNAKAQNFQIESGIEFPTTNNELGKLFYLLKNGQMGLYVYNGTEFVTATIVVDPTTEEKVVENRWTFIEPITASEPVEDTDVALKKTVTEGVSEAKAYADTIAETLAAKDEAQTFTAAQRGDVMLKTFQSVIALNFEVSNNWKIAAAGNFTMAFPTNVVAGQSGMITVTQDQSGSRKVTWLDGWVSANGKKPVLSTAPNAIDNLSYYVESTERILVAISPACA